MFNVGDLVMAAFTDDNATLPGVIVSPYNPEGDVYNPEGHYKVRVAHLGREWVCSVALADLTTLVIPSDASNI